MSSPSFLTYPQASEKYGVTVRQLRSQVAARRLTRYPSSRDLRVTLLSDQELDAIYGKGALNTPAA